MFRRAFIEITNVCNLSCGFCAVSARPGSCMSPEMFESAALQVNPLAKMLSLHVMGEPFMHPQLPDILRVCSRLGLSVNLVTNGTLLDKFGLSIFGEKCLDQLTFSLHALAALPRGERFEKLRRLTEFAGQKDRRFKIAFRLRGKKEELFFREISGRLFDAFPSYASPAEGGGIILADKVYLNFGELFEWRGSGVFARKTGCLGLRHHFAILCSGEVVPCCADYDGNLSIGNINRKPLADILRAPEAAVLKDSISAKTQMPDYCKACGFNAPD